MPPFAVPGDPGTEFPVMIDGIALRLMPSELPFQPDASDVTMQLMMDGGRRTSEPRPSFSGVALESAPFVMTLDLDLIKADDLLTMEYIRAGGPRHLVVVWRYICIRYALQAGVTRLYLPRRRKCAPHFYSGVVLEAQRNLIVATDSLPTIAEVDGDPLTVSFATGPVLVSPGAGGIVIAKNAETSGEAKEFTPMLLGDVPTGGEELTLWTYVTFDCLMRPDIRLRGGLAESHVYVLTEC